MDKRSADINAIVTELTALLRLTRTEAQIARVRTAQARREEIRLELRENARKADQRAARLQAAIRRLGGVPDVFADAVGRVAALTKATVEQGQPFSEGLLGDLALEHQLRDRAVFTRVLAEAQDERAVVELMDDLELAHTRTIEWITVRLGEVAQGGPLALAPTPTQAAAGTVARLALMPTRRSAALLNRVVDLLQRGGTKVEEGVGTTVDGLEDAAEATGEVVGAARDAALARAEEVAPSAELRRAARETREDLGTIEAGDLPVDSYDDLTVGQAVRAIERLEDAEDVRVVLRYEQAHKDRKGVFTAARKRMTELAEESVTA